MEQRLQIGEVADLLQINSSKLRYWEQQGLLRLERETENNYRQYSLQDLLRITDILFYRNLQFSTREVRQLLEQSAGDMERELEQKQREIEAQLLSLLHIKQEIMTRRDCLQEAVRLQQQPYQLGVPDFVRMREFREDHAADWQLMLWNQNSSVTLQRWEDDEVLYGVPAEDDETVIWQLQQGTQYAEVLLRYEIKKQQYIDIRQHCQALREMNWQVGQIVSRFLFSANEDGISYDFYKGWIEVWR